MNERRKHDGPVCRSQFRTDRLVQDGDHWFFLTREGTAEGPFDCKADAIEQLEVYIRLAVNDLLLDLSALASEA